MSDNKRLIIILAVGLLAIFIFTLYIWTHVFWSTLPSTLEVSSCTLTKNTISNNGLTSITFVLRNKDNQSSHVITVQFSSAPFVNFMLGSQWLPAERGVKLLTISLNPSETTNQQINVQAYLENGIDKINYSISVVFLVDGWKVESRSFTVTVQDLRHFNIS
jgi:hypothetical protein